MKAVEFIKKFGWEEVIKAVKNVKPYEEYIIGIYAHEPIEINNEVFINRTPCKASVEDLKQLIDAWELVKDYKDRENGRWFFIADYCNKTKLLSPFDSDVYNSVGNKYDQAIALVEEIENEKSRLKLLMVSCQTT